MSLHRRNPRRDANEKPIVEDLQARGYDVTRSSGKGAPDLLVRKRWWMKGLSLNVEVKAPKGKRTKSQEVSQWPIVRSVTDMLELLCELEARAKIRGV